MAERKLNPETIAAQSLGYIEPVTGAIIPPITLSTTYERGVNSGRVYSRPDNPTYDHASQTLTALEGGASTLLFSSGLAAATSVFLALNPLDHVLAPKVMYWALRSWLKGFATNWGLRVEFFENGSPDALRAAIKKGATKLVWLETPANPTWVVSDIAAAADIAREAGARLAVDSTAATPVLTRPLSLGADIVVHSATKYLNGHSDAVVGTVTTAVVDEFWARIKSIQTLNGAVPGAFEAWLLQRGMRTLFPRMRWQCTSALTLAARLCGHPCVEEVLYPGLSSFPGYSIACRQMQDGYGGMLSIRVKGGAAEALAAASKLQVWKRATSLGGVESLVEHRASVEGADSPVPKNLLRLSVGLEAVDDLFDDLDQALGS